MQKNIHGASIFLYFFFFVFPHFIQFYIYNTYNTCTKYNSNETLTIYITPQNMHLTSDLLPYLYLSQFTISSPIYLCLIYYMLISLPFTTKQLTFQNLVIKHDSSIDLVHSIIQGKSIFISSNIHNIFL